VPLTTSEELQHFLSSPVPLSVLFTLEKLLAQCHGELNTGTNGLQKMDNVPKHIFL